MVLFFTALSEIILGFIKLFNMKYLLALGFLLYNFYFSSGQAQWMHSYGGTVYFNDYTAMIGFNYNPRINFKLGKQISFGPASDIGLGLSFSSSTYGGSSGSTIVDIPVYLRINIGHGSRRPPVKKSSGGGKAGKTWPVGGYFGIGYGSNKMSGSSTSNYGSYSTSDSYSGKTSGIYITFGFSIKALKNSGFKFHVLAPLKQYDPFTGGVGFFHLWGYKSDKKKSSAGGSKRRR